MTAPKKVVKYKERNGLPQEVRDGKNEEKPIHGGADCLRTQAGELGTAVPEICRSWDRRADLLPLAQQVCGDAASDLKRLKQLEEENSKLKKLVADLS